MKKTSILVAAIMLLGTGFQAGYAQNLNKHIHNADNVSIDYLIPSNEYIIGGITHPPTVGGMSNTGAFGGNLERIQLGKLDDKLNDIWHKTYAATDEAQTVWDGQCASLSNYFTLGDAKQTADEGFIMCGRVRRDPETSGCGVLSNYDHMFLLKTDRDGNVQWFKRYDQYGMLSSVVEAPNGDFITCGYLGSSGLGMGVIIYTDPTGNLQWSKQAQTPAYWDPNTIILSEYNEVINYQGNFALVGIANTWGTIWGGTLITLVDGAGSYLQNSIIDNENYGYTMTGRAIADANDGEVVITGMAGAACQEGAQVFILKIDPNSMGVNFFRIYSYNNWGDASWGSSITTDGGDRIFVTGRDATTNGGGGLYLETDYGGNLNRYTPFFNSLASWGKGITYNSGAGIPAFSGQFFPGGEPTFVIKNDLGYDCSDDMYMPDYTTPYDIYDSRDIDPGIKSIDDDAIAFDWNPKESIVCGSPDIVVATKNNTATNITHTLKAEFTLAPNPATDYIDLAINNASFTSGTLKLYDVTGRIVMTREVNTAGNIRIHTATLQPGMYMLQVEQKGGNPFRTNFIKN